jgi:hypothetical protein
MSIITERLIGHRPRTAGGRLLWFVGLYAAGVVATVGVATVLRAILVP